MTDELRDRARKATKKLHDERRALGVCINSAKHGRAYKGGRCEMCWSNKLAGERGGRRQRMERRIVRREARS